MQSRLEQEMELLSLHLCEQPAFINEITAPE